MTNRQNAKLNMAQRISDTLVDYEGIFSGITPVKNAVSEFQQIVAEIRSVATEQFAVKVPVSTQEKHSAESKMIDASVRVANVLYVVGFETDNKELINLLGLNDSSFCSLADNAKLTLAQHLYELSQKHSVELEPYGYDEQKIDKIGQMIVDYQNLIAKPMNAITVRKQKTGNLKELYVRMDSVLYDKLDKLILLFKSSHPDFYGEYRTSRNFIDFSVRHKQEEKPN
jgi:hypothetical protein